MSNYITTTRNLLKKQHADFISDVARLANELQQEFPNMTRTHALKEAERIIGQFGIGVSLAK